MEFNDESHLPGRTKDRADLRGGAQRIARKAQLRLTCL